MGAIRTESEAPKTVTSSLGSYALLGRNSRGTATRIPRSAPRRKWTENFRTNTMKLSVAKSLPVSLQRYQRHVRTALKANVGKKEMCTYFMAHFHSNGIGSPSPAPSSWGMRGQAMDGPVKAAEGLMLYIPSSDGGLC